MGEGRKIFESSWSEKIWLKIRGRGYSWRLNIDQVLFYICWGQNDNFSTEERREPLEFESVWSTESTLYFSRRLLFFLAQTRSLRNANVRSFVSSSGSNLSSRS